jgi:HNH endonuclease/Ribbon-helix-helix protein, copG family
MSIADRFYRKVSVTEGGCHVWSGAQNGWGYGRLRRGARSARHSSAHRVAWELKNGPVPDGLFVLHRCDNRACVNPDHLWLGTHSDNMRDMIAKGRHKIGNVVGPRPPRPPNVLPPISVRVSTKMRRQIEELAAMEGCSISAVCRRLVTRWLERDDDGGGLAA